MKIKYFVSALLVSLFLISSSLDVYAATTNYDSYTGQFYLNYGSRIGYLEFASNVIENEDQAAPYSKYGIYKHTAPVDLSFDQVEGYTYNGYMTKWVDIEYDTTQFNPANYRNSNFYVSNVVLPEGVTFAFNITRNNQYSFRLKFTLQFTNYIASYTGEYRTYLNVHNETVVKTDDLDYSPPLTVEFTRTVIEDYTGDLYQFVQLEDSPGYEGTTVNQNNQIINNIESQTEQQHNDAQNQLNATQQQTEQQHNDANNIMNGYDPSVGNQANTDFTNSTADLEAAEDTLFGKTSYDQINYNQFDTFFALESVSGAILFVKSALEAMYSSLGIFGIPISIGLVLLVFTRLIGFQNFTSGGG